MTAVSESVWTQITLFGTAFLWGMAVLWFYDWLRIIRRIIPHSTGVCAVQDTLFWICEALFVYKLLFQYDHGSVRNYTMAGLALGMILYAGLLSRLFVEILSRCIRTILKTLSKPFRVVFRFFARIFRWIGKKAKKIINYCVNVLKKLRKRGRMDVTKKSI